jgi:hypothetical protein
MLYFWLRLQLFAGDKLASKWLFFGLAAGAIVLNHYNLGETSVSSVDHTT